MVYFTCNHCGESVKKPAVEKHYNTRCRGAAKSVSCMDCQKDFYKEEYVAHTKCISEAQKYSGKGYVEKESANRGAKKQESWMDIIRAILHSSDYKLTAQARSAFERIQSFDNVPRKKEKFQNFIRNCVPGRARVFDELWRVLEKEQEKMKMATQQENAVANTKANDAPVENDVKREATVENGLGEAFKKKSKKEKKAENGTLQQSTTHAEVAEENGHGEPLKKKSKKEKKTENGTLQQTATNGEITEENGHGEPAKKKSKKEKKAENGTLQQTTTNAEMTEENGHGEPAKKKSKKEKKAENDGLQQTTTDGEIKDENITKKSKKKKVVPEDEVVIPAETNGNKEATEKKARKHKAEKEDVVIELSANDTTTEANTEDGNFEWSAVLEIIVRKSAEGITLEKLKKRVLKKYAAKLGAEELTEKHQKKFEKKFAKNLKKSTAVKVEGEIVKAC